jgi:hypothetical protein
MPNTGSNRVAHIIPLGRGLLVLGIALVLASAPIVGRWVIQNRVQQQRRAVNPVTLPDWDQRNSDKFLREQARTLVLEADQHRLVLAEFNTTPPSSARECNNFLVSSRRHQQEEINTLFDKHQEDLKKLQAIHVKAEDILESKNSQLRQFVASSEPENSGVVKVEGKLYIALMTILTLLSTIMFFVTLESQGLPRWATDAMKIAIGVAMSGWMM